MFATLCRLRAVPAAAVPPMLGSPLAAFAQRWMKLIPPPMQWSNYPPKPGYMPRREKILLDHVGHTFMVHSGRDYKKIKVTTQMVDHKFGEFVLTRKRPPPIKDKKQKKR